MEMGTFEEASRMGKFEEVCKRNGVSVGIQMAVW